MGSLPRRPDLRHRARPVQDRLTYPGSAATHEGRGGTLPPHGPPATASIASGTRVCRLSPCTCRASDRGPPALRPAWHARHPSLAVRTPWPSCWCRQRGQALTQKPGGSTFQTLARREDRQRRTRGRSGTAADLQEWSAIRVAPERGVRGGRHPRHGQSAAAPVPALLSPWGGDEVRQGAAAIGAPCRTDGGQERRLAAQPCAGQSSGAGASAAGLLSPRVAAQTGVPL
jgi:hypothetical protein